MTCPNPSCGRDMRLIEAKVANRQEYCGHCGRRYPPPKLERFDLPYWKCDNCLAAVFAPEELNLMRVTVGVDPKCSPSETD